MFFLVLFIYYPAVKTLFKSLFLINSGNMPVKYVGLEIIGNCSVMKHF